MSGLAGAVVCVVTRGRQHSSVGDSLDTWHRQYAEMLAAYQRLVDASIDVEVTLMQVPNSDDEVFPGGEFPEGREFSKLVPDDPALAVPWPQVKLRRIFKTEGSVFADRLLTGIPSGNGDGLRIGRMPSTINYTDLFDERLAPEFTTNPGFLTTHGHPPKDFLICVDRNVVNPFITRPFGSREAGIVALGMSNETLKWITREGAVLPGGISQNIVANNMLIEAIRAVRRHFGTVTEASEFYQYGYFVGSDGQRPVSQLSYDTVYGAIARQLDRVAVLNGI